MKRLIVIFALLLLASASAFAQCPNVASAVLSNQSGNWSSTSTWVGGVVPVNRFVVINNHHVTIDTNVQSCTIILQGTSVHLDDDGSPHTLTFYSTGTNASGSGGLAYKPTADATMMGFLVAQGGGVSNGLTLTNTSITTQDNASPWYAYTVSSQAFGYTGVITGGTTFTTSGLNTTTGTTISFKGAANSSSMTLSHVGTGTASNATIHLNFKSTLSPTSTLDIENVHLVDADQVTIEGGATMAGSYTFKNNLVDSPRFAASNGFLYVANANPLPAGADIEQNVMVNLTNKGFFMNVIANNNTQNLIFKENSVFCDGAEAGLFATGAGTSGTASGWTIQYNYYNCNISPATLVPMGGSMSATDTTLLANRNIIDGGYQQFGFYGVGSSVGANVFTISENWMHTTLASYANAVPAQGGIITYNVGSPNVYGTTVSQKNVIVMDCGPSGSHYGIGALFYSVNGSNYNTILQDHDAWYFPCASSFDIGFSYGEGTTNGAIQASSAHSNIGYGGRYGYDDGNTNGLSTFTGSPQYASVGVHHNLTFGVTTPYLVGASKGTGWDNGTNNHPNAVYGDISTANPNVFNINALPQGFDAYKGGAGTVASLEAMMKLRWCGTGCGYNPAYTVQNIWSWLMPNFTPYNGQLSAAGYNGTDMGPRPVFPAAILSN